MADKAGKNVSTGSQADRPSAVPRTAHPAAITAISLQALALALVARLSLDGDHPPQTLEEQFLFNHYTLLKTQGASWPKRLQRLLQSPAPQDQALIDLIAVALAARRDSRRALGGRARRRRGY